jgi:signal transduction histidine kinase
MLFARMGSPDDTALIAAIADDLPAGVWVATAPEGRFVYSNKAFEEIMGMGPVADVGVGEYAQPYGIFTREGHPYPEARLPFVLALQARAVVIVDDIVIHRRDGRRVYVRAFGKPMFDSGGEVTHIAIAFFDISREAEAQDAREKAQAKLAQTERLASIGIVAAGVAHEVNNPLSYVIGNLDLIARELGTEVASDPKLRVIEERLRDARHGAERVRAIVRDLKVFSRVQDARPTAVDVRAAMEAALQIAQNEIRHRAQVRRHLLPVPFVWGEEGRIGQLFLNLLINAAHAIPDGNAQANEIGVATRTCADGWVEIAVTDTGIGMPPEVLAKVFDPFFTTKPVGAGTGLGLSISHAIALDLGGRMEVESQPGKGTTFRVLLPPAGKTSDSRPPPQNEGAARGERRGSVLAIDDEPHILKVIKNVLGIEHDVTCEPSATAALDRFRQGERFDVILCDLMMPQVTGIDLYDALLEIAPKQAQAMLFLTGGAFTARAQAFVDRVPNAVLEKPFNATALVTRVRQILGS